MKEFTLEEIENFRLVPLRCMTCGSFLRTELNFSNYIKFREGGFKKTDLLPQDICCRRYFASLHINHLKK